MPLLVIHDQDDREVTWDNGAAITREWPGAELVTTTGLAGLPREVVTPIDG